VEGTTDGVSADLPYELTASEALRAIRRRTLGVVELVRAVLDRIDAIEPQVRAWVMIDRAGALARARELERQFEDMSARPLFGIPVGLKDIYDAQGLPTTAGFEPWKGRVPPADATTVARLRQAGAIILGKTVTTQFAFADPPETRNPWNPERTPGGSSSGSAAAVAARMIPLALGSQTAGSILRPAAYCGVLGLKPTYGLVSRHGIVPLAWSLDHPGPIARSVEDLARALGVLAGVDPCDPATRAARVGDYLAAVRHPGPPPVCLRLDDFFAAAEPPVSSQVSDALDLLARHGAEIRHARLVTDPRLVADAQQTIMQVEAAELHAALHAEMADHYAPRMRALVETGALVPATLYVRARRVGQRFRAEMLALLTDVDCLVLPTVSNLAPDRSTTGDRRFQAPWSLIGFPALTIPVGLVDGLPCGLQVVAGPWQEERLFRIARWIERVLPPLPPPRLGLRGGSVSMQ
jgi:aspartyl-tRNA(Asn)/glutamyl-tRNA(Gln) amidotransferase subunit A